jgi:hypothetical protein
MQKVATYFEDENYILFICYMEVVLDSSEKV